MTDVQRAMAIAGEIASMVAHVPPTAFEDAAKRPEWTPTNRDFMDAALAYRRRVEEIMKREGFR